MKETLDQKRARFAWQEVQNQDDKYTKLAKGLPVLIMQSGLMPVLAFLKEKGGGHHDALLEDLCRWLQGRFPGQIKNSKFSEVMTALMGNAEKDPSAHGQFYRMATEEALAILRWIRQFSAAVSNGESK